MLFRQLIITQKALKMEKVLDHNHDKYITTLGFNKLTADSFGEIKKKNLASKNDIVDFVKNKDFDREKKRLATKVKLKTEQDKTFKLQTFDLSYFCGKSHFENDETQNYLLF